MQMPKRIGKEKYADYLNQDQILQSDPFQALQITTNKNGVSSKNKQQSKKTHQKWNYQENEIFLKFYLDNLQKFCNERTKRREKVFKHLSDELHKHGLYRSYEQCRGHFKKLKERVKIHQNIVQEIEKKIQRGKNKELKMEQNIFAKSCSTINSEPQVKLDSLLKQRDSAENQKSAIELIQFFEEESSSRQPENHHFDSFLQQ